MDKDMARKIVKENDDYSIKENYSGKFMFGEKTTAVIVPTIDDQMDLKNEYGLEHDDFGLDYVVY